VRDREGSAFGSFLLGLGIGAVLGFLFAPEPGEATRGRLQSKLRGLRDLAAEKAEELGEVFQAGDDAEEEPARDAVEERLTEAKRRRRRSKPGALPRGTEPADEEYEPVA
jgi:gas vesicle protein